MRKTTLVIFAAIVIGLLTYTLSCTPRAWQWNSANLQVHVHSHSVAHVEHSSGQPRWEDEVGYGWSKRDLFLLGWRRKDSVSYQDGTQLTTEARIVGVSARGVSVKVVRRDSRGGIFNFDKTLFITTDAPVRVDISNELYITARFEANGT